MVATAPKKSNTLLIVVIILIVLGLLTLGGGFVLLKVVPSLILNKLTGTTQINPNQNPLEKIVGGLTGNKDGTGGGLLDGGGGGGLGGSGGGTVSDDEAALQLCILGQSALGLGVGAGFAFTGKEKFNIAGQTLELCCMAAYDISQGQTLANAEDRMCGDNNETLVYTHKVDGKFVPYMAGYKKGDQNCSQIYDESGNIASNFCE